MIHSLKLYTAYKDSGVPWLGQMPEHWGGTKDPIPLSGNRPAFKTGKGFWRFRLIADVVTGKLDVLRAAARLPEEVEEPEPLDEGEALAEGDEECEGTDLDAGSEEPEA